MRAPSRSIWRTAVSSASLALFALAAPALAQEAPSVTFEAFDADISVNADGSLDVLESISGTFRQPRHGLIRFIPVERRQSDRSVRRLRLRVDAVSRDGERAPYESFRSGAFQAIRLGDPDAAFSGAFRYEFAYHVEDALLFRDLEDELQWNVTGEAWDAPLPDVRATVKVVGAKAGELAYECFPEPGVVCDTSFVKDAVRMSAAGPMAVSVRFPKNLAHEPNSQTRLAWWLSDHWDLFFPLLPLFIILVLLHRLRHHGRAPVRHPTAAREEPPALMRPAELAMLVDDRGALFAATLADLAVRGFLAFRQEQGRGGAFVIERVKPDGDLSGPERELMDGLFASGAQVRLAEADKRLFAVRRAFGDALSRQMAEDGFYLKDPREARLTHAGVGIGLIVLGLILGGEIAGMTGRSVGMASLIAAGGFFLLFAPFVPRKTEKGAVGADLALAFKGFLSGATVERTLTRLPYAIAFGIGGGWKEAFASAFGGDMDAFVSAVDAAAGPG